MRNDGRSLEALIEFVERAVAQEGFEVAVNRKLFNENGKQLAEFDVVVKGSFGSTEISWLIECRNRPSAGAASGEWIQQLGGRRNVFKFDKVTAVSTTGFSESAIHSAAILGIELREVAQTSPAELVSWLTLTEVELLQHNLTLGNIDFVMEKSEATPAIMDAVQKMLLKPDGRQQAVLVNSLTGARCGVMQAFREALEASGIFEKIESDGAKLPVEMEVSYEQPSGRLSLHTKAGDIRIKRIKYFGTIQPMLRKFPVENHAEYRSAATGEAIAQTAHSKVSLPTGEIVTLEFKKIAAQDHFHVDFSISKD